MVVTWPHIGVTATGPTGLNIWLEVAMVVVFAAIRIAIAARLQEHVPAYLRRIGPSVEPLRPSWAGTSLRIGSTAAAGIAVLVLAIRLVGMLAAGTSDPGQPSGLPFGGQFVAGIATSLWTVALVLFGLGALASLVGGVGIGVARLRRARRTSTTQ